MSILWLGGELSNALEGGTFSGSPAANALLPFSSVADGDPSSVGRFGSLTADPWISCDLDILKGTGGGEIFSGGSPGSAATVAWTEANTGTGDVTQEAAITHSGSFAIRCAAGTGVASCYADVSVRAGDTYLLTGWCRTTAGGLATVRARNLHTGRWYSAGFGWSDTEGEVFTEAGTTYVEFAQEMTIEDMETCQRPVVTLRIQLIEEIATATSYFDDVELMPKVNFLYVGGHNITPRNGLIELRGSEDNFVANDVLLDDDIQPLQPSFYKDLRSLALGAYRYLRLQFVDTNVGGGPIYMGEWWLGQLRELQGALYPMRRGFTAPQVRIPHRIGAGAVYGLGTSEQRAASLQFLLDKDNRDTFFREVYLRSLTGAPGVLVQTTATGHTECMLGRLSPDLSEEWQTRSVCSASISFEELAFPLVTE